MTDTNSHHFASYCYSLGPMSIIYLTLVLCLVQCLLYLSMWSLARRPRLTTTTAPEIK